MLRYDTPADLREFARECENNAAGLAGAMILGGLLAAIALFLGAASLVVPEGSASVAAWCGLYLLLYLAGIGYFGVQSHRLSRWRLRPRIGAGHLEAAHSYYAKLTPEHRDVAMPVLDALYRLAGTELAEAAARREVESRMGVRVDALRTLVQAEDRQRLAAAEYTLSDRDDLDALAVWREAMAEVEAKLGPLDRPEPRRSGGRKH
jgi:hypothetical protein